MKKSAFTMIELIFVIVILGILAAVAIPKLASTKDDAQVTRELADLRTARVDMSSYMLTNGDLTNLPTNNLKCFVVTVDANKTMTVVNSTSTESYCPTVQASALANGMMASSKL